MLECRLWGMRCRLSLLFPALITALLLWQPKGPAVACLLASLIHETGHLAAMVALGIPPQHCTLGAFGIRIDLRNAVIGYGKNFCVAVAGPLMNGVAAVLLMALRAPMAAMVHIVIAVLNLLPAAALDGGEMLRCVLGGMGLEAYGGRILCITSAVVLMPLAAGSMYLFFQSGNPTLAIVSGYLAALVFFSDKCEKSS